MRGWVGLVLLLGLAACAQGGGTAVSGWPGVAGQSPGAGRVAARPPRRGADVSEAPQAVWRVVADGTTGCADSQALDALRRETEAGPAALRRLAALRARGGCVTAFRVSEWRLLGTSGALVRLAPAGGGDPLYFRRDEVTEERSGSS